MKEFWTFSVSPPAAQKLADFFLRKSASSAGKFKTSSFAGSTPRTLHQSRGGGGAPR